ncbi:aminotransferase class V-fold PLP-dependent enzyme [Arthrobacter sp. MMS18-M83]|uniref:aminotransferase class V-fold PLP-dependent enzyme n=1 Tax=Arthrobacter sp. MMS18-M83 TaxID=2996261 RepID=UPI00227D1337|nr:aminotransferase class V-fold PLP-dependent enzyme [Arthrobacter sp. MMS18-M83]WAH97392.1 aminotransferase class V-fold PLP-dependent enzyme [Arthrobacter sp. MMS18-M83]
MSIDVDAVRGQTRGVLRVTHLNNAGSSLAPGPVMDTVVGHLRREQEIGGYEAAEEAANRLEGVYSSVARLIGAGTDEIALAESGSRAWAGAVYGFPFVRGSRVLIGRSEYAGNVIALRQLARRNDLQIVVLEDDPYGQVDVEDLQRELERGNVAMVALAHVPMANGLVNPASEVGRRCRAAGVMFVLDACQSVGQMPLDVQSLGCDVLAGTGRKFLRGPRGTAFLYVRAAVLERLEPAMLDGHSAVLAGAEGFEVRGDARRFESWETSAAGRLGLGRAADYALALGLDAVQERVVGLAEQLRAELAAVPGVIVHDRGITRCGIVTFSVKGSDARNIRARLAEHRINVSVAPAFFQAGSLPVGTRLGEDMVVRASVHYYNTEAEIQRLVGVVWYLFAGS